MRVYAQKSENVPKNFRASPKKQEIGGKTAVFPPKIYGFCLPQRQFGLEHGAPPSQR